MKKMFGKWFFIKVFQAIKKWYSTFLVFSIFIEPNIIKYWEFNTKVNKNQPNTLVL